MLRHSVASVVWRASLSDFPNELRQSSAVRNGEAATAFRSTFAVFVRSYRRGAPRHYGEIMPSLTGSSVTDVLETTSRRLAPPPLPTGRPAIFLDMDGVLAPLAPTPEAVVADPRRTATVTRLVAALDGRVAVLSGRTLDEIDRIADGASPAAAGVHGLTRRRANGDRIDIDAAPGVAAAEAELTAFAEDRSGLIVERKGVSVGLHYRAGPQHEADALAAARDIADRHGLRLQPGILVVELKTPGADKGTALTAFMQEPPFAGAVPIMLGDDLTDEHAFAAAEALGGYGILVGPPRQTRARHGLADPDAVLDWLDRVSDTLEAEGDAA